MFRDMKEDVCEILKEEVNSSCYETLMNIFGDLEGVGVDDEDLENYYSRKLGNKYSDPDTGFARFLIDFVSTASSLFCDNEFTFSFEEYVRSITFRSLEVFIVKSVDIDGDLKEVCSEEIVLFYLQDRGIQLTEEEFFFVLGYEKSSDIQKFFRGMKSVCSIEFDSKETDGEEINLNRSENDGQDGDSENDFETLDDIEMEDIEEEDSFEDTDDIGENGKKEEAEASFEELFGDED